MDESILDKSLLKAQEIFNAGANLRKDNVKVNYTNRDDYLRSIVGEDGYITFIPQVTTDILLAIKDLLIPILNDARSAYVNARDLFGRLNNHEQRLRDRYTLIDRLYNTIEVDHLLNNTIPDYVNEFIKECDLKELKSPKLSKLLVHLCGEKSEIVKWYTCKCPKTLQFGELDEYRLTVSILPHHIAGMSYFASLNWGGEKWEGAHAGTSCCDPIRNTNGGGLYTLGASLNEETLAIAYLSFNNHDDIFQPIYQARVLLRVCYLNENTPILIACRTFGTSKTAKHIIIEGLKNKFGNVHYTEHMNNFFGARVLINHKFSVEPTFRFPSEKCVHCNGIGHLTNDLGREVECPADCNNGYFIPDPIFPYIDDANIIVMTEDEVSFYLPEAYLDKEGLPHPIPEPDDDAVLFDDEDVFELE
jgi:hypothetical protein